MADQKKKGRYIGMAGALIVHALILLLLFLIVVKMPEHQEESGVEVMMGNTQSAFGGFNPATLVDVQVSNEPLAAVQPPAETPVSVSEQEMITQDLEESVAIQPKKEKKKEAPKKETPKKETVQPETPKPTAAEIAAEQKRLAEEKAERERKAAAEAAEKRVAGAFGKGEKMADSGTGVGKGQEGSPTGNSMTGAKTGTGGYGSFDLGGRSLGPGGLPRPVYNVQEEGRVVVTITVNPQGVVVRTEINRLTNTVNAALRKAAEEAAKKARFNEVDGVSNQTGTITYYFNLN